MAGINSGSSFTIWAVLLLLGILPVNLEGQISPGELSEAHSHLEGISNCTKCHEIGKRINQSKCLSCHADIDSRIKSGRGYHSSQEVKSKQCFDCHNEHHGKNFRLIRFETGSFDHNLTGYRLSLPHSKTECAECHQPSRIHDPAIRKKKYTWLGLGTACLDCHEDFHLGTLSPSCLDCHTEDSFESAPRFSHDKARFKLAGRHRNVECEKCHKAENVNDKRFVEFRGVSFSSCRDCHKDPHNNQFGPDCRKCHNENSFSDVKELEGFDHTKTGFPLEGKHVTVDCRSCHKNGLSASLKHEKCIDCHDDFHKGEFTSKNVPVDCSGCHTTKGFQFSTYTLEQHNRSVFPLNGAHLSVPCTACHRKGTEWTFRKIGRECRDCHVNIHREYISQKYYPGENCLSCHSEENWIDIRFDHSQTSFALTGRHESTKCGDCHFIRSGEQIVSQQFRDLRTECSTCHTDTHEGQFAARSCSACHVTSGWGSEGFDHNKTAFRLEGQHQNVSCGGCHKTVKSGSKTFTLYKIQDFRCESCHL